MPIHDWSRVNTGTFHDFHLGWIVRLSAALNNEILPATHYALIERATGEVVPDVVLGPALSETEHYLEKQNRIAIHRVSDDRVVSLVDVVSPANKAAPEHFAKFIDRCVTALGHGQHLVVVDLHAPTASAPHTVHHAISEVVARDSRDVANAKPFTMISYHAVRPIRAIVETAGIGVTLPDMPLFLEDRRDVTLPLEETYKNAYRGIAARSKQMLEG